jgi:ETC complex I subunit conserved region
MVARIYQPSRSVMQSGKANSQRWVLEFTTDLPKTAEPLMGWTTSADTKEQVRISFASKEAAVAYAKKHGIAYEIIEPSPKRQTPKSYADNFRWGKPENWTH